MTVVASVTVSSEVDPPIEDFITTDRSLREHVAATRVSVGLPETVEDPIVLARIAALLKPTPDPSAIEIAGSRQGVRV